MAKTSQKSPFAVSYAAALLELANEKKQAEQVGQELAQLRQVVEKEKTFQRFLSDPSIGEGERGGMLKRIFGGKVSTLVEHFLGVLNQKGRAGSLAEIIDAYQQLLDEQLGKIEVDVTVAKKLDDKQLEQVRQKVSTALKKDAVVKQHVDDSIIGGLIVRVQDKLLDASVRTQLDAMKQQLLSARTK